MNVAAACEHEVNVTCCDMNNTLTHVSPSQGEVFKSFLNGTTLQQCYDAVGAAANHWLDIMDNQGADLHDADLFDLISESKNMTETLEDYGDRKSTAVSG